MREVRGYHIAGNTHNLAPTAGLIDFAKCAKLMLSLLEVSMTILHVVVGKYIPKA